MIPGLLDTQVKWLKSVKKTYTISGKEITFESGKLALFADGAVTIGDADGNYLLTTCGVEKHPSMDKAWFALSVDYQERFYATGRLAGWRFNKREGRPSTSAILSSRLIDRPIRPMFPKWVMNSVQIIPTIFSATGKSDFSFYGITGASLAIQLAGIHQFEDSVSGVRIALTQSGEWVFDPTFEQVKEWKCELLVAGTATEITMVEFQWDQVDDEEVLSGFVKAQEILSELASAQADFIATYKKQYDIASFDLTIKEGDIQLEETVLAQMSPDVVKGLYEVGKMDFHEELHRLSQEVGEKIGYVDGESEYSLKQVEDIIYETAVDIGQPGEDNTFGHGRIDAGAAVQAAVPPTQERPIPRTLKAQNIYNSKRGAQHIAPQAALS